MSIEEAIRQKLLLESAVTDLVGSRIRPDELAEGDDLPAIVIEIDREQHANDLSGLSGAVKAEMITFCLAETKKEARALDDALKLSLADFKGISAGVTIDEITRTDTESGSVLVKPGTDEREWFFEGTWDVLYQESVPA